MVTIEKELIFQIKSGRKDAFQKLYNKYAPHIYQFAISYLKNEFEAEELVQEVFIKIWEKRDTLDSSKNIRSFIFKIAVNAIYEFIRKRNIEKAFIDFAKNNFDTDENYTWHSLILSEMQENLNRLVGNLPEQQRKIFHLSREKGLSNDEISEELNLSKRTVENHLYRAISYLKKHFKGDSLFVLLFLHIWCG